MAKYDPKGYILGNIYLKVPFIDANMHFRASTFLKPRDTV